MELTVHIYMYTHIHTHSYCRGLSVRCTEKICETSNKMLCAEMSLFTKQQRNNRHGRGLCCCYEYYYKVGNQSKVPTSNIWQNNDCYHICVPLLSRHGEYGICWWTVVMDTEIWLVLILQLCLATCTIVLVLTYFL